MSCPTCDGRDRDGRRDQRRFERAFVWVVCPALLLVQVTPATWQQGMLIATMVLMVLAFCWPVRLPDEPTA